MLSAVFIDIDNTLLDFDAYVKEALRSGFDHFGLGTYSPYIYEVFERENTALWEALERREITMMELMACRFNKVFAALGISGDGPEFEKYFRTCLHESAIPVDGAEELLAALSEKFLLCAASNGPYLQQLHRLHLAGFDRYLTHMFISEDLGASKPAREFFDAAFSRLGATIAPEECLMIGDSLTSDMAGAAAYGMQTCFFNRSGKSHAEKFTYEARSLREIPGLLSNIQGRKWTD